MGKPLLVRAQLVRLVAEAYAAMDDGTFAEMAESMDLSVDDLRVLFETNEAEWEMMKEEGQ